MLEAFHNGKFEYKRISPEEQKQRQILGRLVGVIADTTEPTRNGRHYSKKLWQNVFNDPIMKEKIANRCVFLELGHPADRAEIDMEKICACLAEQPKIGDDGKIYGTVDILNTKNGRILKTLCDYGTTVGISSRGEGDLITGYDGQEEVDPDTYTCETWDIVLVPSVKSARLQYVTESLDKTRYNKTLRQSLQESLNKATAEDQKIMTETLDSLGISLNNMKDSDNLDNDALLEAKEYIITVRVVNTETKETLHAWQIRDRGKAFEYINQNPYEPLAIVYSRYRDGQFLDSKILARRATLDDLDNLQQASFTGKIHFYIDGEWVNPKTSEQLLADAINDPKHLVLISFGSRITKESLNSDSAQTLLETFDELEDFEESDTEPNSFDNTTDIEGVSPEEMQEIDAIYNTNQPLTEAAHDNKGYFVNADNLHLLVLALSPEGAIDYIRSQYNIDITEDQINETDISNWQKTRDYCRANHIEIENANDYDIQDENLNINEVENSAVDNNEAIVEELQKQIKARTALEQQVISLQEKLSVCYAKEAKQEAVVGKYKATTQKLTESSQAVQALRVKTSALEKKIEAITKSNTELTEQLGQAKSQIVVNAKKSITLKEKLHSQEARIDTLMQSRSQLAESLAQVKKSKVHLEQKLTEQTAMANKLTTENTILRNSKTKLQESANSKAAKLNENFEQLKKDFELQKQEYNQKVTAAKQLTEKYKKVAQNAIDKYIASQATRLGSSVQEIKSRLPESYTFADIDRICEDLQVYNLTMSKLPINTKRAAMNEGITIKGTSSKNESILPVSGFDDDVDDDLKYLAGI